MRTTSLLVAMLSMGCASAERTAYDGEACPSSVRPKNVPAGGGDLTPVEDFGENPGKLAMYVHAPPGDANAVVVAMHGCTQGAADYAKAGWNELADRNGFVVVYPEQSSANDPMRCFHWYQTEHATRDRGEAASIAAMTEYAKRTYGATRAFVTGLSAGGVMTAVMLATYPDLFEAGAVMAGIPYGCASSQLDAFRCMSPGKDLDGAAWAALVPKGNGPAPRVSIWHGDQDYTVRPKNEESLARQWTAMHGLEDKPTSTETVGPAKHAVYKDAAGVAQVETWLITGMGHGTALSPSEGCGTAAAYMLDVKLCSTSHAASFFGLETGGASSSSSGGAASSSGGGGANAKSCE